MNFKYASNDRHKIKSVSELSYEDAMLLSDDSIISIQNDDGSNYRGVYTKKQFFQIREKIDEIISKAGGIPKKGDFESELKAFSKVYSALSHIKYDFAVPIVQSALNYKISTEFKYNSLGSISSPLGHSTVVSTDFTNIKYETFFNSLKYECCN